MLDNIALLKENAFEYLAPLGRLPQEKFEIHPKVLAPRLLGISRDHSRLAIFSDGDPLLAPMDGLRFIDRPLCHPLAAGLDRIQEGNYTGR
jgi:hypothetical protein